MADMADDCLLYRIALSSVHAIKPSDAMQLVARLGSEAAFFEEKESALIALAGRRLSAFGRGYRDKLLEAARRELDFISRYNINVRYYTDKEYPLRLSQCEDAPLMIYSLGKCDLNTSHVVSIVGTRHATAYGTDFVNALVADLASSLEGLVIVSGLAYGTDVNAHRASLDCGVPTIGVLAHGLNKIYPASHRNVADRMLHTGGMLLTEYISSDVMSRANFLARNRIIAGLADCTVVVESDLKGGSLVTAEAAVEYNRDVMALPGRVIDRYSRGCNKLIADNKAALITSGADLMACMNWQPRPSEGTQQQLAIALSAEEEAICGCLRQNDDVSVNDMALMLDLPVYALMSLLVDMEFKGIVAPLPGARYRLVNF